MAAWNAYAPNGNSSGGGGGNGDDDGGHKLHCTQSDVYGTQSFEWAFNFTRSPWRFLWSSEEMTQHIVCNKSAVMLASPCSFCDFHWCSANGPMKCLRLSFRFNHKSAWQPAYQLITDYIICLNHRNANGSAKMQRERVQMHYYHYHRNYYALYIIKICVYLRCVHFRMRIETHSVMMLMTTMIMVLCMFACVCFSLAHANTNIRSDTHVR